MNTELSQMAAQQRIHELIAQHAPLATTLDAIADWLAILLPDATVAFMRYDPRRGTLSLLPSRHFSSAYIERLQGVAVGPGAASFGSAAFERRLVVSEDIARDPRWERFRDAALAEGFRACWSSPVITADGQLLGTFGTYYRVSRTPTPASERLLRQAAALIALALVRDRQEHRLHLLERGVEASPNGVIMAEAVGPDYPIVYANRAFCTLSGYPLEEVLGRNCRFLQGPDTDPAQVARIRAAVADQREVEATLINYRKDGTPFWNRLSISPVFDAAGRCSHFIGIQQDITEQRQQAERLRYQASHDLLTGLPNRGAFDDRLAEAFAAGKAQGRRLAVLHLDLDGFKSINDGLGPHIGNRLLVAVARRLETLLDTDHTLARLVSDEFAVLLPSINDCADATALTERLLEGLAAPLEVEGQPLHISTSIGIACSDDDTNHPHEVLQRADLALEEAKRQGRNTWQRYRGRQVEQTRGNVLLRNDLHTALRDGQFELLYQPLVEALSGRVSGFEALVRWRHPRRGLVSPAEFIPLAEHSGQIIPLGRWVLRQACREMAEFHARGGRVVPVAVNISSLQFRRDGFLDEVLGILAETGLPPSLLELEVTESVLLDGAELAIALIDTLRGHGVRVALDDFGTGFSSLSYLRDLPIDKVKLDRSFICDTLHSQRSAAIVQGIITMSHHMDLTVVAEGIETVEQQRELARRGADLLQGYLFSRPLPLAALAALPERLPAAPSEPDP
ncbi:EAL domain-containing protein [uncultured Halomonas sp.]|uniref:putative bifunctional diguanylate cyclase/phosphodiesterase n=1 Tax=uncultured Halomonas sp. TaxID=173971 RepID=UPI00262EB699|nr:EAL domain-containing protein [uncultured Halomonas sp.]